MPSPVPAAIVMLSSIALCGFVSTAACTRSKFASEAGPWYFSASFSCTFSCTADSSWTAAGGACRPARGASCSADLASARPCAQPAASRKGRETRSAATSKGRRIAGRGALHAVERARAERDRDQDEREQHKAAHDDPALEGAGATRGVAGGGGALDGGAQDRKTDGPVARHVLAKSSRPARSRRIRPGGVAHEPQRAASNWRRVGGRAGQRSRLRARARRARARDSGARAPGAASSTIRPVRATP